MRQAGEWKELEGALRGLEREGKGENHMLTKNVWEKILNIKNNYLNTRKICYHQRRNLIPFLTW